jgi:hypothetical protein
VAGERLRCAGSGRRSDPFRYWLPEREPVWCELYGTEWQSVSEAERATLYWRAKFLQDIDVLPKTNPGDEPPEAIMVVPRFERDPRDPPGVGSDW